MYIALCILLALMLCWCAWKWFRSSIGFGILFSHYKDGRVLVESRLLGSPAEEAGLIRYEELLQYNGHNVTGLSKEDFRKVWAATAVRKVGEKARLKFKRITTDKTEEVFEVEMTAKRIWTPAPDYGGHHWLDPDDDERWRFRQGMFYCRQTGYLVPTCRLSDEALDRVLCRY